jgi:hypothetical protein
MVSLFLNFRQAEIQAGLLVGAGHNFFLKLFLKPALCFWL